MLDRFGAPTATAPLGLASPAASEVIALTEMAVIYFDKVDLVLYGAVARRPLGKLVGGRAGEEMVATAHRWMAEQNVVDPERCSWLFAPGFPGGKLHHSLANGPSCRETTGE